MSDQRSPLVSDPGPTSGTPHPTPHTPHDPGQLHPPDDSGHADGAEPGALRRVRDAGASREQVAEAFKPLNSLPIPWVDPIDISNAVLFLASDESRYVTGLTMTVDAGATAPYKAPPEA
jgi:NAD(P)-dependent dehydrogenase (short-subunit alcohol dehydrogenase family)